jgi:hypothetical protein
MFMSVYIYLKFFIKFMMCFTRSSFLKLRDCNNSQDLNVSLHEPDIICGIFSEIISHDFQILQVKNYLYHHFNHERTELYRGCPR